MLDIAIMIEGQNGLNWPRWQRIARLAEDLGFAGLYRSDHFTNASPPDLDSLELWVSLSWLADNTQRIEFGPLVTPVSFRHPTITARMAAAVDDLSNGRLTLGVGGGWQKREHANYGWDLLDVPGRFHRLEEGLEVITKLMDSDVPVSFEGQFFRLQDAILLPRPARPGGPPILVGGNGPVRTLPLAARFADEWNAVYLSMEEFSRLNKILDERLDERGRAPSSVRRSMMTGCIYASDDRELRQKVHQRGNGKLTPLELQERGLIVGTASEMIDQLGRLADAGLQRVMLQWLDLDDLAGLEAIAAKVLPHFPAPIR